MKRGVLLQFKGVRPTDSGSSPRRKRWPQISKRNLVKLVEPLIHAAARISRPLTIGVRAIVFDDKNRVYLVRHGYVPGWHFPGGGVEAGESANTALYREVLEETLISILGTPHLHGIFHHRKRDHVLVYVVRSFKHIADRPPDWEIAEGRFFSLDDLPDAISPATAQRLAEVLDGAEVDVNWQPS